MRPVTGLLMSVVLFAAGCEGGAKTAQEPAPGPGDHTLSFVKANGAKQEFLLHAPEGFSSSKRYPLIVVLHGSPGTPSEMQHLAALDDLADSEGFITVYPNLGRDPDTVGQLLDFLVSKWSVDPKHMHLAGFSAGASAVYGLAQTPALTSRLGSVAPVSGAGGSDTANTAPISLITFQGGRDDVGQAFTAGNANWAKAAQCDAETVTELKLHDSPATRHAATCKGGAEFVYYDIEFMGHTWPPDASPLIWEFFKKHPLA
jgi:polyhydroxybutyrate depolymerase